MADFFEQYDLGDLHYEKKTIKDESSQGLTFVYNGAQHDHIGSAGTAVLEDGQEVLFTQMLSGNEQPAYPPEHTYQVEGSNHSEYVKNWVNGEPNPAFTKQ